MTNNHIVSEEMYAEFTTHFPVVCVDMILFNPASSKIGVIERATGSEKGKLSLIGGRVRKDETLEQAIRRHLHEDINVSGFDFHEINSVAHPFIVQQYRHDTESNQELETYDPTKHAIGLNYVVLPKEKPRAQNEAATIVWLGKNEIPATTSFNQGTVMLQACKALGIV